MTRSPRILLIGPYDPLCGEYTFLAPPLGVWRLAGVLESAGIEVKVFDPNCCAGPAPRALERELLACPWDVIGVSTTGMTLRFDLELAHLARRLAPQALLLAGGMEATFKPELMFQLGPFDCVVLGEGERPLLELVARLRSGASLRGITGTAERAADGGCLRMPQRALDRTELRDAIFRTPYEKMPYGLYWERLEEAYRVGAVPTKAAREARLAEIRSVRLITLNYCPMGCTFCSSTNFLHEAQGSVASIARLDAEECVQMIQRIVSAHPRVRTVIFQDDIFVFTKDRRVLPLCEAIVAAKESGVLNEFNKAQIYNHIRPTLTSALELGITPFLDLILSSPRATLADVAATLREAYHWLRQGCEVGMYPYVIPFSGAAMSADPALRAFTVYERRQVAGTEITWDQPSKILPMDPSVREVILRIERDFEESLLQLQPRAAHLPSRLRSLLWIQSSLQAMAEQGLPIADEEEVRDEFTARLPQPHRAVAAPRVATA